MISIKQDIKILLSAVVKLENLVHAMLIARTVHKGKVRVSTCRYSLLSSGIKREDSKCEHMYTVRVCINNPFKLKQIKKIRDFWRYQCTVQRKPSRITSKTNKT
jgi:hypothetical protein